MHHSEFTIGGEFWYAGQQWRCTDVGTRTIVAIRIAAISVTTFSRRTEPPGELEEHPLHYASDKSRRMTRDQAEAEGWFRGPPYSVEEHVFDEPLQQSCTREPETDDKSA
jgi:hypothetical protein